MPNPPAQPPRPTPAAAAAPAPTPSTTPTSAPTPDAPVDPAVSDLARLADALKDVPAKAGEGAVDLALRTITALKKMVSDRDQSIKDLSTKLAQKPAGGETRPWRLPPHTPPKTTPAPTPAPSPVPASSAATTSK